MASFLPLNTEGIFLPTTGRYDSQLIESIDINSPEFKTFLVSLQEALNDHALYINLKTSGRYDLKENINGNVFFQIPGTSSASQSFNPRQDYRTVVNFGPLPNNNTTSIPHNIPNFNADFTGTRIYATATNPGLSMIPIPTTNAMGEIYIDVDNMNVNITTTYNASNYTRVIVVIEYLKTIL